MTLWLIRAGSRGEHEQKFLDEGKVYVAWDGLNVDLKAHPLARAARGALAGWLGAIAPASAGAHRANGSRGRPLPSGVSLRRPVAAPQGDRMDPAHPHRPRPAGG